MDIVLIDAPCNDKDEVDFGIEGSLLDVQRKSFNPGLLAIGSRCAGLGLKCRIIAPSMEPGFRKRLEDILLQDRPAMIAVSIISGMAYKNAVRLIRTVKELSPDTRVIAGGWHIYCIGKKIFEDCPALDAICVCEGEEAIAEYYESPSVRHIGVIRRGDQIAGQDYMRCFDLDRAPVTDFSLYENHTDYRPFIEESRSCPRRCIHCIHSKYAIPYRCTSFEKFRKDFDHTCEVFGNHRYYTLLAANFGIDAALTRKKLQYMAGKHIYWSAEMHVENPWEEYIDLLAEAGMKSVTVGLETTSPRILKLMRKTADGARYVARAEQMVRRFHNCGIRVKVNVMSYPDETSDELSDTLDFIRRNSSCIKAVNTSAILSFPNTVLDDMFQEGKWKHSWKMHTDFADEIGLFPVESALEGMRYEEVIKRYTEFRDEVKAWCDPV